MLLTVALAVGLEPSLLATLSAVWKSAGIHSPVSGPIREAIDHFRDANFDLALLGDSISVENRDRLALLMSSSGSQASVVSLANCPGDSDSFADATLANDSSASLRGLGKLPEEMAKLPVVQTILYGNASKGTG